jgi:hypothetical protein
VHFTAEYVFFSGFGLLLSFILVDNEEKKRKKKLLSSAGNEFFQFRTKKKQVKDKRIKK